MVSYSRALRPSDVPSQHNAPTVRGYPPHSPLLCTPGGVYSETDYRGRVLPFRGSGSKGFCSLSR
jgi:hypothetical protein